MKDIIEACIEFGSPSAIYYKGQELMGNVQKGTHIYKENLLQGVEVLGKLKKDDTIYRADFREVVKKDKTVASNTLDIINPLLKTHWKRLAEFDITELEKYNKPSMGDVQGFFGKIAHSRFTDPKRKHQHELLKSILRDDGKPLSEKLPLLLGAMDAIESQIGDTRFISRLKTSMDKMREHLGESVLKTTGKSMDELVPQELRAKAIKGYLNSLEGKPGALDQKFVEKLKEHVDSPKVTSQEKKLK